MSRLLLVDDEAPLRQLLGEYLARAGYDIVSAADGATALRIAREELPDLVVLDIKMPGTDGWRALEQLRAFTQVPVIMLTALSDEPYVLRGFALGADDYVPKPFSFAQLEARIRRLLERVQQPAESDVLRAGDLVVDLGTCRVQRAGTVLDLTPTELKLLVVLMERPGRVLSLRQLVTHVWGQEYADDTGYVRRYIWHLRQKVEPQPDHPRYIHNERSFGYFFQASEEGQPSD